ncbi:MAG TPA: kelch repeat-containing protein, partial [Myxococcota bacterium]|nr:kelch repeat-containing protein [Myxococcota bacterium]
DQMGVERRRGLIGGVTNAQNVVSTIATATLADGTLTLTEVGATDLPRYCQCAFFDPTRDELVVLGGRGRTFADAASSAVIDTTSWRATPLSDHSADDFPVGCVAFFSPLSDKGYVFGGLSTSRREFSPTAHRYDPTTRTFEALPTTGPAARYDAAVHVLSDGDALLLSGMGLATTATFYDDVWRFDAEHQAEQVEDQPLADGTEITLPPQSMTLYIVNEE